MKMLHLPNRYSETHSRLSPPFRQVHDKVVRKFLIFLKVLLKNFKRFRIDVEYHVGDVLADVAVRLELFDALKFARSVESEVFHNVLVAKLLDFRAQLVGVLSHDDGVGRISLDGRIVMKLDISDSVAVIPCIIRSVCRKFR